MSIKAIVSWITLGAVVLIIFFSRKELIHAWELFGRVNLGIVALLIPLQLIAYYAAGETIFSYLRSKGHMRSTPKLEQISMALELNFVNHTLPSAGVSGLSYMTWRLNQLGVSSGRAASAQVVRYAAGFMASIILIPISVILVTIDGGINRWIILISAGIVFFMIFASVGLLFLVASRKRMQWFAKWATQTGNRLAARFTRGRIRHLLDQQKLLTFFDEMHDDYVELKGDVRILKKPVLWALLFTVSEALLFAVTFWALGTVVNPGAILIAYSLASVAGFIVVTPGGAGAYEAIMVAFLSLAGIVSGAAIAAVILTRVIVLLTTIGLGYIFYQRALIKYGRSKTSV